LGGIADTVAQGITAYRTRQLSLPTNADTRHFISSGVELEDLNEKPARLSPALSPTYNGPPAFDFERMTRFFCVRLLDDARPVLLVRSLNSVVPSHGYTRNNSRHAAGSDGSTHLCAYRSQRILHLHDRGRRRRKETHCQEVSGHLHPNLTSELYAVARRADAELPSHAAAIPDTVRQYYWYCMDGISEFE
jgi:hypothetical protein